MTSNKRRIEYLIDAIGELVVGLACVAAAVLVWQTNMSYRFWFLALTVLPLALSAYSLWQYVRYDKLFSSVKLAGRGEYLTGALANLVVCGIWLALGIWKWNDGGPTQAKVPYLCLLVIVVMTWGLKVAVQMYCWLTYPKNVENIEVTGGIDHE